MFLLILVTLLAVSPVPAESASLEAKAGALNAPAARNDGTVGTWGVNCCGQLGNGTYGNNASAAVPVEVLGQGGVGYLSGITSVAAGFNHSLGLNTSGSVLGWGYNSSGQLGDSTTQSRIVPVLAQGVSGLTTIAAGNWHSLGLATTHSLTQTYGYDHLYRLTSGGVPGQPQTYTYDPVGNRLTSTSRLVTTSSSYDKADRLSNVGGTNYTTDSNGNLTSLGGSNTLAYDQANRLLTATLGGLTSTYTYDGDGKRATRTVGASSPITYTYDVNASLPLVLDDGSRKYVYGLGLAYTVDDTITATVNVLHTDGLGSVRAITDSNGNVVQTFQSDEFGIPLLTQGTNPEPFRYTGQQRDAESGFYDLRARYYSPGLGRFVSRDSLFGTAASPLSLNRYGYVDGNPVNVVDPSGTCGGSYETGNFGCWAEEATPFGYGLEQQPVSEPSAFPSQQVGDQAINQDLRDSYQPLAGTDGAGENGWEGSTGQSSDYSDITPPLSALRRVPQSWIKRSGGESWTSVTKKGYGGARVDLYYDPATGMVYTLPKAGGGEPQYVGDLPDNWTDWR
jgi:RHS repeat-associated protein